MSLSLPALPVPLDYLYFWSICKTWPWTRSPIHMCPLWNYDSASQLRESQPAFFKMKKNKTEVRRHHIYVIVLWRLSQDIPTTTLRPHLPPPTHSVAVENTILLWIVDKSLKNTSLDNFIKKAPDKQQIKIHSNNPWSFWKPMNDSEDL